MNEPKKKLPVLSVVFYVLAAILMLYAVWALINCNAYISKLIASGQLSTNGNEFTITSYYMTNCIQYFLYSVAFFFFGKLYCSVSGKGEKNIEKPHEEENEGPSTIFPPETEEESNDKEDEFSDWKSSR